MCVTCKALWCHEHDLAQLAAIGQLGKLVEDKSSDKIRELQCCLRFQTPAAVTCSIKAMVLC